MQVKGGGQNMEELPCQSQTCLIGGGVRLEKIYHCVDNGSCGLNRKKLVNKGVEFGNHYWWTKYNSMEKLLATFEILICYLSFCFDFVCIVEYVGKDGISKAPWFYLFHWTFFVI